MHQFMLSGLLLLFYMLQVCVCHFIVCVGVYVCVSQVCLSLDNH